MMNLRLHPLHLFLGLALAGLVHAEVPRKQTLTKYRELWTDSPFTAKPVGPEGPVYNPLQDYVLLGVSPIRQGYRVTLMNKKQPSGPRLFVESHRPSDGFKILEVNHKEGDPLATTVRLTRGSSSGLVAFEEKFLKLAPPPAARTKAQPAGARPPTTTNENAAATKPVPRAPRRPVVQPGTSRGSSTRGARPPQGQ